MADLEPAQEHKPAAAKKLKRKQRRVDEEREEHGPSKTPRIKRSEKERKNLEEAATEQREPVDKLENGPPWRNLQLVLSLQNKDMNIERKVELAFDYVKLRASEVGNASSEGSDAVSISRVIVFLNNWVQSLLISSEKKIRAEGYKPRSEIAGLCLDYRCWEVFKFCLEESLSLHVPLSFSRDFLRVIHCIARDILSRLNALPPPSLELAWNDEESEFYSIVLGCVSLVFLRHGGILNDNLDLWILTADTVLELVKEILCHNLDGGMFGAFVLQLSGVVLEPFAHFLRIHPTRKNGFHDFINKLLEPLLHLLEVLHIRVNSDGLGRRQSLLKIIEEIICHGLFHPTHMDGFLSLLSTSKYATSEDGEPRDSKIVIKSYHRHLFDKLEKILAGKNVFALAGIGEMFRLFVNCAKSQKGAPGRGGIRHFEDGFAGHMSKISTENKNVISEDSIGSSSLNAETRKPLFDFFVQIMEPLLLQINIYLQDEHGVEPVLLDVHSTLTSANKILVSFMHEKLYVRTEDISRGAFPNFLKMLYDLVLSFSAKIRRLGSSMPDPDKQTKIGILKSIAKELVLAVQCLVDIDYQVLGNDLESLWLMMLSCAALDLSLPDATERHSLPYEILHLGCQFVNVYSELRQVNTVIFALCNAVRRLVPGSSSVPSSYCHEDAESVRLVLCSQDFRLAIHNAVLSIPEGQVGGCIRQLKQDISESLEWIKASCPSAAEDELGKLNPSSNKLYSDLPAELLGRGLSDIYTVVLDSLTVTGGNSNLIRVSVKDLMIVLRRIMSGLVAVQPESVEEFCSIVTGKTLSDDGAESKIALSSHGILLCFFRLYMSCRSLYRQALSLVPPDISLKMSAEMCDIVTAYSGKDWLERTDWTCGGYFSWIIQPSAPLFTILHSVSDNYVEDTLADCSPLVYVLNTMALQRLVDVNRLIKSFEYLLQRNDYHVKSKLTDDVRSSIDSKNTKKWKRFISGLRQEAADLTNFIMGHLSLLGKEQISFSSSGGTYKSLDAKATRDYDTWDVGVGALNEKSLPCALWWIICRNIDVWCPYAAKKKLKLFLSHLIQNSLLREGGILDLSAKRKTNEPVYLQRVTRQISLELLGDTVLYEQRFVRRHMASTFCRIFENSVLAIFSNAGEVDLKSSPDWLELLSLIDNSSNLVCSNNLIFNDSPSVIEPISSSLKRLTVEYCKEQKSFLSQSMGFTDCQTLLSFLGWMPKGYSKSKSYSLYGTYVINLERFVVACLLDCSVDSQNRYELFKLFLSCRRALKNLIMASCEENIGASPSSLILTLVNSSYPTVWLLKSLSAVIVTQYASSEDTATKVKDMIFPLMDHTSYVFLALSKFQFLHAFHILINEEPSEEQNNCAVVHEQSNLVDLSARLDSKQEIDAWKTVVLLAETLKEQMKNLLISQKEALYDAKAGVCLKVSELINLSAVTSCSQGFLWGLTSALDHMNSKGCDLKTKLQRWKYQPMDTVNCCIDVFEEFINYFIRLLVIEDDQMAGNLNDGQTPPMSDGSDELLRAEELSHKTSTERNCYATSEIDDPSDKGAWKKRFPSENADCMNSILAKCDPYDLRGLKKSLLQGLLKGEYPEAAYFLRQLFAAASAVLRLKLQINRTSLSLSSVPIFIGISLVLIVELANKVEVPLPFSFVWLDGIAKYLEELGSHFTLTDPMLSRNLYVKLVDLHLMAIGKCIVLQQKRANLASHDSESSTKTLDGQKGLPDSTHCSGLEEFKTRLRMSFKVFVQKASELHLLSAIQALERALVGLRAGCTINYEISTGSSYGGKVTSIAAAAVDCLDLVLEYVTGRKRSNVVRRHIQSLVACLFNIILHLQGPCIFYENITCARSNTNPDPGAVILMNLKVLTRVIGKHAMYPLDACFIGQSLRIPAALFQNLFQRKIFEASCVRNSQRVLDKQDTEFIGCLDSCVVDRQYSVDLFAGCCRLLSTVLKHYKSKTEQCAALLEDSVSVLLNCLEMVDTEEVARRGYFVWGVPEGMKCASSLRRIYEEIRQQKDIFSKHSSLFLSSYIWTYSGYGPRKTGIRREIDEALRPGVYALIDACSADDLQHLHTVFGEGPCRSTLATLQHDYKLNFQYEGKV